MNAVDLPTTRPYFIRALYEWCTDNGYTPHIAVKVDDSVQVPREFVKNNEIVLNISYDATSGLKLDNEFVSFQARFGGLAREIIVPIERIIAIYARENGQGMAFPVLPAHSIKAPAKGADLSALQPAAEAEKKGMLHKVIESAFRAVSPEPHPVPTAVPKVEAPTDDEPPPKSPGSPRPSLKRIK